jgi:hypothetical protein
MAGVGNNTTWRKSTKSGNTGNCLEAGVADGGVVVRDTKDREQGTLAFTSDAWQRFTSSLKQRRAGPLR